MNLVADVAATAPFVSEAAEVPSTASLPVTREVHRLADTLLPFFSRDSSCCLLLLDVGGTGASSLWLATSVGSALGVTLKTPLHVLSTDPLPSRDGHSTAQPLAWRGCVLESVPALAASGGHGSLVERLAELQAANQPVLLHAGREDVLPEGLLQGGAVSAVVLLARAARTRRAALQATVHRLSLAGVSLLGCVLLDRTHPIPEKLYHLL